MWLKYIITLYNFYYSLEKFTAKLLIFHQVFSEHVNFSATQSIIYAAINDFR